MKHVNRTVGIVVAVIVTAIPPIVADPSFRHFVDTHPWAAAYLPLVSGVVVAVYKAVKEQMSTPPAPNAGTPSKT